MDMFHTIIFIGLGIGAVIVTLSAVFGATFFDRALMVNALTSYAIAVIVIAGIAMDTEFFVDIAIAIAIIGFISMTAALRYVRHRCMQDRPSREGTSP